VGLLFVAVDIGGTFTDLVGFGRKRMVVMGTGPSVDCSIYERAALAAGTIFDGSALIQEYGSTTVVFPQDRCEVARTGELVISVAA
jgi:N-methylhydantoinase A/oxoprolinase/acetone carboxylase beta subunit